MRAMTTSSGRRTMDWSWMAILVVLFGFWMAVAFLLEALAG